MTMQCKSKIIAAIHETAEYLHTARVMPTKTLWEFDALCLAPVQESLPEDRCLNVTTANVSSWKRREKHPQ